MPIEETLAFFNVLKVDTYDQKVADRILTEIKYRWNTW